VLRAQGYRTVAVHPFDAGFFGRDRVFPNLGFERFDAEAAFAGVERSGRYVSDAALGAHVLAVLREATGPACVFAIGIAAHGPWDGPYPEAVWAARMAETDAMLGALVDAAPGLGRPVLLAAWGDHLPALPGGGADRRTPWLVWRSDREGAGPRRDVAAHELFEAVRRGLVAGKVQCSDK